MRRHLDHGAGLLLTLAGALALAGCGKGAAGAGEACDPQDASSCDDGLVCEATTDAHVCAAPVLLRGQVFDLQSEAAIAGARVVALDLNGAPVSAVATTGAEGQYELRVPISRSPEGALVTTRVTLRADASGYASFPGGLRTALPIEIAEASVETTSAGLIVEQPLTHIGLLVNEDPSATASIHGQVALPSASAAVLVVAESGDSRGHSAIADTSGAYRIFNLPEGEHRVTAYALDAVYERKTVTLGAGAEAKVDLATIAGDTHTVTGSLQVVQLVAGVTDPITSVILVVSSTFDPDLVRGAAPVGFYAGGINNNDTTFSIAGVPPGTYKILAAFEDDELVRDPNEGTAGTAIVEVRIPEDLASPLPAFKVTSAVKIVGPGASGPEVVTEAPTFRWMAYPATARYELTVIDAYGEVVWADPAVNFQLSSLAYGGDPLVPGMVYQWRLASIATQGTTSTINSVTEDLMGVFVYDPAGE